MSVFLSRTHLNRFIICSRNSDFLQNRATVLSFLRWISSSCDAVDSSSNSFVVSYLINSCGLSPESALSASKHVNFKTSKRPDAVLSLLHNHLGLSKPQVSNVVKSSPRILLCDPHKSISPKLDFLRSKGASISETAKLVLRCPRLLYRSLKNHIANFNFLRGFMSSDEAVLASIFRVPFILSTNIIPTMSVRMKILRDNGVPESAIARIIKFYPRVLFRTDIDKFKKNVEEAKGMGLRSVKPSTFVKALITLQGLSKSTWERKVDVFKSWGLSEEEVLAAFWKEPFVMATSVRKIMAGMDIFVNKLGWEPSIISKHPVLVQFSLEKRLIPRALVLQFLLSKRLIKNDCRHIYFFVISDAKFMGKYVYRYEEAPEILKVFHGKKMDLHKHGEETM